MKRLLSTLTAVALAAVSSATRAEGFAAIISPPRFELKASPGSTLRQVIEVTNHSATPSKYHIHTADFSLAPDYTVVFKDELQPGSCRPWVAIERPQVTLGGGATIRYRYEVQVPKDAPAGECRFAILIQGDDPSVARAGALQIPVVGRIGIIVYVIVGNAKPQLEIFSEDVLEHNGRKLPALRVHNDGDAHARITGFLTGTDAAGHKFDFTPSNLPILPGEVREVLLQPSTPTDDNPVLNYPVTVKGTIEWGDNSSEIDERFQ